MIFPVVLYERETLSFSLWEEHTLRIFENRAASRTFGFRKEKVTGWWVKLHIEELRNFHSLPNITRVMGSWRIRMRERAQHASERQEMLTKFCSDT
jgi:hypothetical protein